MPWVVSLRKSRITKSSAVDKKVEPKFWRDDMEKWKNKFVLANKNDIEDIERIKKHLYISTKDKMLDKSKAKSLARFTTIDSVLLKGNSSPVIILNNYSTNTL